MPLDSDLFLVNIPGDSTTDDTVELQISQFASAATDFFGFNGLDPFLQVFNAAGTLIAENDDSIFSLNSEVVVSVPEGSQIIVRAGAFGFSTGGYDLTFESITDDFVDTRAGTGVLEFETPITGVIERPGDVDVFQIGVPTRPDTGGPLDDVRVQLDLTATDGSFDGFLTVFRQLDGDLALEFVAQNDDSNGSLESQIEFELKVNATYFVFAESFGSGEGSYELAVTEVAAADDDFGNSFEGAETIEFQTPDSAEFSGLLNSSGDLDVFTFTSARNGSALVELDPVDGLDGRVSVFAVNTQATAGSPERQPVRVARSPSDSELLDGGGVLSPTATLQLTANNQYFVVVDSVSGLETGSYTVDLQLSDVPINNDNGVVPPEVLDGVTNLARDQFARDQFADEIDLDSILDAAALQLLQFGELGDDEFFIFVSDPVDFILADSDNRQVGFTADQGRVNEVGGAQLSQEAPIEVLILPTSSENPTFDVQLQGVGTGFQVGGRVVSQAGVINGSVLTSSSLVTSTGATVTGSGALGKGDGNVALVFDFTDNAFPIPQPVDPTPVAEVVNLVATDADTTAFQFLPGDQIAIAEEAVRATQDVPDVEPLPPPPPNLAQWIIDYLYNSEHEGLRSLAGALEFLIDTNDGDDSDDDTGVSGSDVFWSVFGGGVMNHLWELGDQIIEQIDDSDADSERVDSPEVDQTQPESPDSTRNGNTPKGSQPDSDATQPPSNEEQPASDGDGQETTATPQPQNSSSNSE